MIEDERRAVQADTLRRLAYYFHAQDVIGDQTDAQHEPEEREWWRVNVSELPLSCGLFYGDDPVSDFAWFTERADLVEAGTWTIPERFYDDDPE